MLKGVLFFSFVMISFSVFAADLNVVAEDTENFPFIIGSGVLQDSKPGVAVEAIKSVGEKLGFKVNVIRYPWKRCLENELKDGKADVALMASFKEERLAYGAYPMKNNKIDENKSFTNMKYSFYRRVGTTVDYDGKKITNLDGAIGGPKGYSVVVDLSKAGYKIEESMGTNLDFKKLVGERINLVIAHEETAASAISKDPTYKSKIEKINVPYVNKPYYFMLSNQFVKKNPDIAEKFWTEVKNFKDKELSKIYEKYAQ